MIGRRPLIGGGLAAFLPSGAAFGQTSGPTRSIAVIASNAEQLTHFIAFRTALDEKRRDDAPVRLRIRFADDHPHGPRGVVADVLAERPELIVTVNTPVARAALAAHSEIRW